MAGLPLVTMTGVSFVASGGPQRTDWLALHRTISAAAAPATAAETPIDRRAIRPRPRPRPVQM